MKTKMLSLFTAVTLGWTAMSQMSVSAASALKDSGIDYRESTETILNPGMGYTSTLWYHCKPNDTPVQNPTGSLVLMFINIGAFSSGVNCQRDENDKNIEGTGKDYPLDDAFFAGLRGTFENARKNGCTIALRFRYDELGHENPEPATYDMMVSHVMQIKESGILDDYKDILMYVESGLVGCYGEQWGGKYCSTETKAKLLDLWLDVVPDDIPVTVRTPNIFAAWANIKTSEMDKWTSEAGSRAARIGLYNDGYMGSSSDLGTYGNREIETEWLSHQATTSYYGGEFSGNLEFTKQYETYLPQNAIPEMYKTHLSYINSNIYALYKDYTFGEAYDVENVDNSAYYGENVWKFMRDHLGYRFCLRDSDLSESVSQGGTLEVKFAVENTGFANPIRPQKAEILLEKDGNYIRTDIDVDSRKWYSCETALTDLQMQLPSGLEAGKWNVYLKLSVGENTVPQLSMRSVRFSNADTWNSVLGANYLGSVQVTASSNAGTENAFYQTNTEKKLPHSTARYTVNGICSTDGILSAGERAEERLAATNENGDKLYLWNDETYFYVSFSMKQTAVSPVYNIQLQKADETDRYWLYFESNGAIYFNHGNNAGAILKYSDSAAEFRIPLGEMMGLSPNTKLSYVRVFLQDQSIQNWPLCGEIKSGEVTLSGGFPVYTAPQMISLPEGKDISLHVETGAMHPHYQWMHDGKIIENAVDSDFLLTMHSMDDAGSYSVVVTSESGMEKEVAVAEVQYAVNAIMVKDVILLQKYLLTEGELTEAQGQAADYNADGHLSAADFAMMKRMLLRNKQ